MLMIADGARDWYLLKAETAIRLLQKQVEAHLHFFSLTKTLQTAV
jgi:hypothetical protein